MPPTTTSTSKFTAQFGNNDLTQGKRPAVMQAIVAIIMIAAFVAASIAALSIVGEVAVNSHATQSDIQSR